MRKIIGILVVLGLVLGMVASAVPAVAQGPGDWTTVIATVGASLPSSLACEFQRSDWTITFTPTVELLGGVHTVTVKFPAGTGYPEVWRRALNGFSGHISVNGVFVHGSEVTRVGDEVTFVLPATLPATVLATVVFQSYTHLGATTGIVNPAAGVHFVEVKTSRSPNSTYVRSQWSSAHENYLRFRIYRTYAVYKWSVDFSPTYPGIAWDYVPPFKACGQDPTDAYAGSQYNTYNSTYGWVNNFTIYLGPPALAFRGCSGCTFQKVVRLTSAPTGGVANLFIDGSSNATANWTTLRMFPEESQTLMWGVPEAYPGNAQTGWQAGLHFDKVGTYEICFDAIYAGPEACNECQSVTRCITFEVKQWKDAITVELEPKWNLISLPIVPFDTSIDSVLAPLDYGIYALKSIWHYDRCDDEWFVYGNSQDSLTDIEGGKAYWVRMFTQGEFVSFWTPFLSGGKPLAEALWGVPNFGANWTLWVFGTEKPMAPSAPPAFPVCEGWNMVGLLSVTPEADDDYLWNFWDMSFLFPDYGTIYGWNSVLQNWTTQDPGFGTLVPGDGYWIPFDRDGYIYP